jgi:DNA-binding PucR family transcriptional regulator
LAPRRSSRRQQTVDVLSTLGRSGEAATAQGLGIYRILLTYAGRQELAGLVEAQLGPVLREEERRGVPLLATMEAYLDHGRRHAATAQALSIHVNTLYQRLDTLDRLLGDTWRTGHRAIELDLVLRLRAGAISMDTTPA